MSSLVMRFASHHRALFVSFFGVLIMNFAGRLTNFDSFWGTLIPTIVVIIGAAIGWTAFGLWVRDTKKFTAFADVVWLCSAAVGAALALTLLFAERASKNTNKYWEMLDQNISRESGVLTRKFQSVCPEGYPMESPCAALKIALDVTADRGWRQRQAHRFMSQVYLELPSADAALVGRAQSIEYFTHRQQAKLAGAIEAVEEKQTLGKLVLVLLVALRLSKSLIELLDATGLANCLRRPGK